MPELDGPVRPASSVTERLIAAIPEDVADDERALLASFVRLYVRRLHDEDASELGTDELLAEITDLFRFVESRDGDASLVRVFTPDPGIHGYSCPGSIIEICTDDMPFLVDSMAAAVARTGAGTVRHLHPVMGVEREGGRLIAITAASTAEKRESVQHIEIDRRLTETEIAQLVGDIEVVLHDVALSVRDFEAMREAVTDMATAAKSGVPFYSFEEVSEAVDFLEWLIDDNFVFLGYREYAVDGEDDAAEVQAVAGSGLGILSPNGAEPSAILLSDLPRHLRERYKGGDLLVITKTNRHSTVHRDARMDYVGLRKLDDRGVMVSELRLLGLFTSKAYMTQASEIPVLRRKLRQIIEALDVVEATHDYKSVIQLFETFPKDDLFAMPVDALADTIEQLLETEETSAVRLFVRRDALDRSVAVLVTVPRDRFNSALRMQLQDLFQSRFRGHAVDYRLALGESGDARLHFTVWTEEGAPLDIDIAELEREVVSMARNWDDRIRDELALRIGESDASRLADEWAPLFPSYYKESTALELAVGDILALDRLFGTGDELVVAVQNEHGAAKAPPAADQLTRITVYRRSGKLNLSMVMPMIEDLGLVVVEEVPTRLRNEAETFIHDFGVLTAAGEQLDIDAIGDRIADAIVAGLMGQAESDSLLRLLVTTDLTYLEIGILRAYRSYWRLVTPAFSIRYVDDAFAAHPEIAQALVRLFQARFGIAPDPASPAELAGQIAASLDDVTSLDEDRILRGFLGLILATERTNYLVEGRTSLSLKFASSLVPEMPDPKPLYEIFVYARDVEGVHLRGGMVARGGIRWSDRREDYRTEVLGLMKAQMTKNAVIVPTGAKGGFVIKRSADPIRPTYDEVREGYTTFIRGLLDITDNRVDGEIVPPTNVTRHDGDDPYLVVAADKGTASFSDTANGIAAEYRFWLDDAFASGGSAGYDHKALGITAKGAWESVRRHFLDIDVDVDEAEITVVGIGDMSGDVFGNGMLISDKIKLVAAFDHRDVFIDPDPDPATSWAERKRLFDLPRSSWQDYNADLISDGGGVFSRSVKSIELTPQIQRALDTDATELTPNDLIKRVLLAPVDLLWNGGIGTYVKAKSETNELVRDRSNDAHRVDARELRCKVVGEGGNLGLTQRARIEFARFGGLVFADFIDNSGGVHASDREVNLKILLHMAESRGDIDRVERDGIIESVSDDVVSAILYDNFLQAQIVSQEAESSTRSIEDYGDLMDRLEREGLLDRELEFLPSADEMAQRVRESHGMSRPEIAVLLAYAKRSLTNHLVASSIVDDPHFERDLLAYFPPAVVERFADDIVRHPLRRELIATIAANQMINSQGSTFYSRMRTVTGASASSIVRAYRIARVVTDAEARWRAIEALSGTVDPNVVRRMLHDVDNLVTRVARWYLANPSDRSIDEEIAVAKGEFTRLAERTPLDPSASWRQPYEATAAELEAQGVPRELALTHAFQRALRRAPDVVDLSHRYDRDLIEVALLYTTLSDRFRIEWLERQIRNLPGATAFERLAVEALRDDLQHLRRQLAATIIEEADGSIDRFLEHHDRVEPRIERWQRWLTREGIQDVSAALIAVRRLDQILLGVS